MIVHTPASRTARLGLPAFHLPGGDALLGAIGPRLDDAYHYLPRVAPGGMAPLDVVVGPGGTFAITRFDERGRFRHRNGHWYRWNRSTESWAPWTAERIDAIRLGARRLSLYLERATQPSAVEAVVVALRGTSFEPDPDEPRAPAVGAMGAAGVVIHGIEEPDRLAETLSAEERLTAAQVDRIVALLDPRQPLPRLAPLAPP
jgi:hypothetical protein